jgi:hypothetical protein
MIIGICGFQSSGKDTIANILVNNYGFKQLSFAFMIKEIVSIMFSWDRNKLDGLTKEDREWREQVDVNWSKIYDMPLLTPRYVLQYFATDLFRNHFHQDIWVKIIENQLCQYKNIVISDCRFKNEIDMIVKNGGKIIQVNRNLPYWFYKYKNGEDVEEIKKIHCSEIEWIRCVYNYEICNNGTIEELNEKINLLIKNISNI